MRNTERPTWDVFDWVDLIPAPGSFVSNSESAYEVHGEQIERAANWLHAEYLWLKRQVAKSGEEWCRCAHCNANIRYAVVFVDEHGKYHLVGQDCAAFINSHLNRSGWEEKKKLGDIKEKDTKNGKRFVLTLDMPHWFWDIPKDQRPKFTSCFKGTPMGRQRSAPWYLSIWGESPSEVLTNYKTLMDMKPKG